MEIGSLAEWAGAIASAMAIFLAMKANMIATQANESVQKSEKARMEYQQKQDEKIVTAEEQRRILEAQKLEDHRRKERREQAGVLQVWWVKPADHPHRLYGFILRNEGPGSNLFRDVTIRHISKQGEAKTTIKAVPPGTYFQQNTSTFLEPVTELSEYQPVSHSDRFEITEVSYKDSLGDRWIWTPSGLVEAKN